MSFEHTQQEQKNESTLQRRDLIKGAAAAGVGAAFATHAGSVFAKKRNKKTRYAIIGCGNRYRFFRKSCLKDYKDYAELVAYCDINPGRLKLAQKMARLEGAEREIPAYLSVDFDRMIKEQKPDVIIVTTKDSNHDEYIVRAMDAGCDVITEKPMTTTADKVQRIVDAEKRTGKQCIVAFNYRYSPPRAQIKELLMDGVIGEVLSVDFQWMLNTYHGADYFRRWHRNKANSGGLMVHKSTHHFDLVNWWLSAKPESVFAMGKREYYTPETAKRMGLSGYHNRCLTCPQKKKCSFHFDLRQNKYLKELYLDNEHHDGYFRDRCIFHPEIDIEDTMNVLVRYENNVQLNYSLNAFNSWEGYHIVFNGTKGRIEHSVEEKIYVSGTDTEQGGLKEGGTTTKVIPLRGPALDLEVWEGVGSHGGGDVLLLADLFAPKPPHDKFKRAADFRAGAYSVLVGAAANECFRTGKEVKIADMVTGLTDPDWTHMPSRTGPLPMPNNYKLKLPG